MKSSRSISHTLAGVLIKSAERSLEPKRIVSALSNKENDVVMSAIKQKYADAVIHVMAKHRQAIISDYAIDLVELVQPVLEKEFKSKDLQSIEKLVSSPVFVSLISNQAFIDACHEAKDKMNKKVFEIVNGDEVYNMVKISAKDVLDDMTRSFGMDDESSF